MIAKNLVFHASTGEDNNSFVGIKIIGNHINFFYPESYHFDENNYSRDDILDLLKTISIAKSTSQDNSDTYNSRKNDSELAFFSYVWMIENYLVNGLYKDTEKIYKTNQKGRVNWKRTLQQQPIISSGNVIYKDLIVEVTDPYESIMIEIHKYCLKKCFTLLGWIYGIDASFIEITPNLEQRKSEFLDAIRREKDLCFNDEKHTLLSHMENVLIGLDEVADDKSIIYGVDSYHYVFERMIDRIFGTEKAEDYYPTFTWHLKYSDKQSGMSGPTIRPDTIMKDSDTGDIYIIDSKFYRFGSLDISQTRGLPEAGSIVKQITYGSYVKSENPESNIYNAFIMPFDSQGENAKKIDKENQSIIYTGYVESDWESEKTYSKVFTFLVDMKYVVKTWNRLNHIRDQKTIIDVIRQNED
ncbi:MAG: LlaJI family restriction endonuclease [Lachnospiraceae bacterium]|nr:LlaJI family restriction endonuclease [Lachnospiraceae bacterium]